MICITFGSTEKTLSYVWTRAVMKYLIVLISTLLISSCATHSQNPALIRTAYESDLKNRLSRVIVSDGINKEEAMAICDNYFRRFRYSGCGALGGLEEAVNTWNCIVLEGITGKSTPERIIVVKKTGRTTWKYGPDVSVSDLNQIWSKERTRLRDRPDMHAAP